MGSVMSYFYKNNETKPEENITDVVPVSPVNITTSKIKYLYRDKIYEISIDDPDAYMFITFGIISGNIEIVT